MPGEGKGSATGGYRAIRERDLGISHCGRDLWDW